jgi:hypothetical protein
MSSGPPPRTPEETKRLALKGCATLTWIIGAGLLALFLIVVFARIFESQLDLLGRVRDLEERVKELEKKQR